MLSLMGNFFFDQKIRNNLLTYDNIEKFAIGQGDDYATVCLLDYKYFKSYYKMIAIDLSKQQALLMLIQKQHKKLVLLEI